jgi:hypothetical protein
MAGSLLDSQKPIFIHAKCQWCLSEIEKRKTQDSVETPGASEACLALGLEGVHGIVADRKAASRRTVGLCLAQGRGLVTLVPRPWAVRHALEAWGQQHPALPL